MLPKMQHDTSVKAAVVGSLLAGIGISECARQHSVGKATVSRWRDELYGTELEQPAERSSVPRPALPWLPPRGANWHENFEGYIDDVMYGLRVQVAYLSRPEVLERTDYAAIVDAHGTLADRVARIAEAVGHIDTPTAAGSAQLTAATT